MWKKDFFFYQPTSYFIYRLLNFENIYLYTTPETFVCHIKGNDPVAICIYTRTHLFRLILESSFLAIKLAQKRNEVCRGATDIEGCDTQLNFKAHYIHLCARKKGCDISKYIYVACASYARIDKG